jgi:hypothetical protein
MPYLGCEAGAGALSRGNVGAAPGRIPISETTVATNIPFFTAPST